VPENTVNLNEVVEVDITRHEPGGKWTGSCRHAFQAKHSALFPRTDLTCISYCEKQSKGGVKILLEELPAGRWRKALALGLPSTVTEGNAWRSR